MFDLFAPINRQSSATPYPTGKLVMRAPLSEGSTVELYIVGKALDLRGLHVLREYLDLMERGLQLTPEPPTSQPASGEE